jgi:hypothetical protein
MFHKIFIGAMGTALIAGNYDTLTLIIGSLLVGYAIAANPKE